MAALEITTLSAIAALFAKLPEGLDRLDRAAEMVPAPLSSAEVEAAFASEPFKAAGLEPNKGRGQDLHLVLSRGKDGTTQITKKVRELTAKDGSAEGPAVRIVKSIATKMDGGATLEAAAERVAAEFARKSEGIKAHNAGVALRAPIQRAVEALVQTGRVEGEAADELKAAMAAFLEMLPLAALNADGSVAK